MSHKTTIEAVNRAFSEGHIADFLALCTPDIRWSMAGMGTWEGAETIRKEWSELMSSNTDSLPSISVRKLITDEAGGMCDGTVETTKEDGSTRRMFFCDVYSFSGSKVSEMVSYCLDDKLAAQSGESAAATSASA